MCDGLMVATMISHGFIYLTYNKCWSNYYTYIIMFMQVHWFGI